MKNLTKEIASVTVNAKNTSWHCYVQVLTIGMQDLKDIERKAIFLRYWRCMSIEQVAAVMKRVSLIKIRSHKSLKKDKNQNYLRINFYDSPSNYRILTAVRIRWVEWSSRILSPES